MANHIVPNQLMLLHVLHIFLQKIVRSFLTQFLFSFQRSNLKVPQSSFYSSPSFCAVCFLMAGIISFPMISIFFINLSNGTPPKSICAKKRCMPNNSYWYNIFSIICSLLPRSEEHTSELQSRFDLVCRL